MIEFGGFCLSKVGIQPEPGTRSARHTALMDLKQTLACDSGDKASDVKEVDEAADKSADKAEAKGADKAESKDDPEAKPDEVPAAGADKPAKEAELRDLRRQPRRLRSRAQQA